MNTWHFSSGPYTVFAPSDDAIEAQIHYPYEAPLKEMLEFHLGRGNYSAADITDRDEVTIKSMLPKRTIRFNVYGNGKVVSP